MKNYFSGKFMMLSFFLILPFISLDNLKSEILDYTISKPVVFKRNEASCSRLGNIYDACQWMTKVVVKNIGKKFDKQTLLNAIKELNDSDFSKDFDECIQKYYF